MKNKEKKDPLRKAVQFGLLFLYKLQHNIDYQVVNSLVLISTHHSRQAWFPKIFSSDR